MSTSVMCTCNLMMGHSVGCPCAIPTPQSQIESLQRALAEAQAILEGISLTDCVTMPSTTYHRVRATIDRLGVALEGQG